MINSVPVVVPCAYCFVGCIFLHTPIVAQEITVSHVGIYGYQALLVTGGGTVLFIACNAVCGYFVKVFGAGIKTEYEYQDDYKYPAAFYVDRVFHLIFGKKLKIKI
jgi:hypothetical protein